MHALQCAKPSKSYTLPQMRLWRPADEVQGEQDRL